VSISPRPWLTLVQRSDGAAAVEFALTLPLLMAVLFAVIKFGLLFGNYVQLTDGACDAARVLASERGSSTPYTDSVNALKAGAPGLTFASANYTFTVNGTACTSDATCLAAYPSSGGTVGHNATVTATYACDLNLIVYNLAPTCTLSASTTELIE
jgi:Flp pilus assembly protein TadG